MNISPTKTPCRTDPDNINFLINAYTNVILGLSFAPFSTGLLYYFIFTVIFELKYAFDIKCNYNEFIITQRLILFILGAGSFVVGRKFIANDKNPFRSRYSDCPSMEDIWWAFKDIEACDI